MKATTTNGEIQFESEPKEKAKDIELRQNMNALMDSLKWFHQHGVKVTVRWKRTGYVFTFSK